MAIFGYFAAQIREKKRRKMINERRNHIIVCGSGRVGQRAGEELREGLAR